MKKKIFVLLVIISIIVLTILFINNKSIHISKKMLQEENNMESAWDFKENLNIGWNLGMSLSANIKYPELIKYKLVVDENESNQFETSHENIYTLNKKTSPIQCDLSHRNYSLFTFHCSFTPSECIYAFLTNFSVGNHKNENL